MDRLLFELAEHAFEDDLKRLERVIGKQIRRERRRIQAINAALSLEGTELVGDLDPRSRQPSARPELRRRLRSANWPSDKARCRNLLSPLRSWKEPNGGGLSYGHDSTVRRRRKRAWLKAGGQQQVRKPSTTAASWRPRCRRIAALIQLACAGWESPAGVHCRRGSAKTS